MPTCSVLEIQAPAQTHWFRFCGSPSNPRVLWETLLCTRFPWPSGKGPAIAGQAHCFANRKTEAQGSWESGPRSQPCFGRAETRFQISISLVCVMSQMPIRTKAWSRSSTLPSWKNQVDLWEVYVELGAKGRVMMVFWGSEKNLLFSSWNKFKIKKKYPKHHRGLPHLPMNSAPRYFTRKTATGLSNSRQAAWWSWVLQMMKDSKSPVVSLWHLGKTSKDFRIKRQV